MLYIKMLIVILRVTTKKKTTKYRVKGMRRELKCYTKKSNTKEESNGGIDEQRRYTSRKK